MTAQNKLLPEQQYFARLSRTDPEQLAEIGSKGGQALIAKYGRNHPSVIKAREARHAKYLARVAAREQAAQNGGE